MRKLTTAIAGLLLATMAFGQVNEEVVDGKKLNKEKMELHDYLPAIHGTVRAKYEYQTVTNESRFQVRMHVSALRAMYFLLLLTKQKLTYQIRALSAC